MTYATKLVNGDVVPLTTEEIAALEARDVEWVDTKNETLKKQTKALAHAALYRSDVTVLRCVSAGSPVPLAWQEYRVALRDIVRTGMGTLPAKPAYPEGT